MGGGSCRLQSRRLAVRPFETPGRHLTSCLGCQADAARYRRLIRELATLRHELVSAPASLPALVMSSLDPGMSQLTRSRRAETAAVAGAVALAGAIVVARRRRTA